MGERSNAVVDKLASMEGRLSKVEVSQTEIADGIRRNRTTLETFTGYDMESTIASPAGASIELKIRSGESMLSSRIPGGEPWSLNVLSASTSCSTEEGSTSSIDCRRRWRSINL